MAEDGGNTRPAAVRHKVDEAGDLASLAASTERRRTAALAQRQQAVARFGVCARAFVALGAELFVAHR